MVIKPTLLGIAVKIKLLFLSLSLLVASGVTLAAGIGEFNESTNLAQLISQNRNLCSTQLRCGSKFTTQFYASNKNRLIWSQNGKITAEAEAMLTILQNAYQDGLQPNEYHVRELENLFDQVEESAETGQMPPAQVLVNLDLTLSDGYLLYLDNLENGRIKPQQAYSNWKIAYSPRNILAQLQTAVKTASLVSTARKAEPQLPEYQALKKQLALYQQIAESGGWQIIPAGKNLQVGDSGARVGLLQQRLALTQNYSIAESSNSLAKFDNLTKLSVIEFQIENALSATGVVDNITLSALNQSVNSRLKLIQLNMDRLRWLPSNLGSRYLVVNIPSYSLYVSENGKKTLQMPVIVGGGGENKTCLVNSKITTLELNPYWGIPNRIASKEYLTKIKRDPAYLAKHNIRMYSNSTNEEIDPTTVAWESINQTKFPYFLKQDPGKGNALGKIKFIFSNDCGIYLHDTSNPNLFGRNARSLSHGCVRVGKPLVLADYLLANNASWNDKRLNTAISSGEHNWVKLANPLPIYIVYQTVWVNADGRLIFKRDIYSADNKDFPIALIE